MAGLRALLWGRQRAGVQSPHDEAGQRRMAELESLERRLSGTELRAQLGRKLAWILQARLAGRSPMAELRQRQGYGLRAVASQLASAGWGLAMDPQPHPSGPAVAREYVPVGECVLLYPGLLHAPGSALAAVCGWRNGYAMRLHDGSLLDGAYRGLSARLFRSALARAAPPQYPLADASHLAYGPLRLRGAPPPGLLDDSTQPLAHGQLVNHASWPRASVLYVEVPLAGLDAKLVPLLPVASAEHGSAAFAQSVVMLVAARPLSLRCPEPELLVDYHFIGFVR